MPDVHKGYGATVGSVFATRDVVIPYAVGVDIGCGMVAAPTNLEASRFTRRTIVAIREAICRAVPTGHFGHKTPESWEGFGHVSATEAITREVQGDARMKLGSLGGGNHFIELQRDATGRLWVMLHSGSRHIGNSICKHYQRLAVEGCKARGESPPRELEHLPMDSDLGQAYLADMHWAQDYALENRRRMLMNVLSCVDDAASSQLGQALVVPPEDIINVHHNFAALEEHFGQRVLVHRKGATRAFKDQLGIIPGAMGRASYIVRGKGNVDSFCSCSHGAGRVLSRTKAAAQVSANDLRAMMDAAGVDFDARRAKAFCDEAPVAYKDIDQVIREQADLVEPVFRLEPITVIKGD